jgi:hypothetical protein
VADDLHSPTTAAPTPPAEPAPSAGGGDADSGGAKQAVASAQQAVQSTAEEKPEVLVGAAFAGGFVAAMILKRLGRG